MDNRMLDEQLRELAHELRRARRIVALTGAGISAESGIPTFRDAQSGLWSQYRPEELATPEAFASDPALVWSWYQWRRQLIRSAAPNPGHFALAELESMVPQFALITQNVDGLHRLAGHHRLLELHGSIFRNKCSLGEHGPFDQVSEEDAEPPSCPLCGAQLRPDVVWFGETLPESELSAALDAAQHCEIFLSIGTSTLVYPAAQLPFLALDAGARVVEINPQRTPLTNRAAFSLPGTAASVLPRVVQALRRAPLD